MSEQIDNYKIYNDTLDPTLWDIKSGSLFTDVSKILLKIAQDFYESIEIKPLLHDVLLLGSAAAYNYASDSDIDLHLVIDFKDLGMTEEDASKYVDALKAKWNDSHNIKVKGKDVEVYIQDIGHQTHANGVYSLLHNNWVKKPTKEDTTIIDKNAIKTKYSEMVSKIKSVEDNPTVEGLRKILEELYVMRQKGLDEVGELSTENLTFKLLRHNGFIQRLKDTKIKIYDQSVSITEIMGDDATIKKEIIDRGIRFVLFKAGERIGKIVFHGDYITKNVMAIIAFKIDQKDMRGKGYGKYLLDTALSDPDIKNKTIVVQPHPYDTDTRMEDLVDMYKHLGFVEWEKDKTYLVKSGTEQSSK